jgi:hypothetical protein
VTVAPGAVALAPGAPHQFAHTVTGLLDPSLRNGVTWSATGGSITQGGLYTAPQAAGTYAVKATSAVNANRSAQATVTVVDTGALEPDDFTAGFTDGTCATAVFTSSCFHDEGEVTLPLTLSSAAARSARIVAEVTVEYFQGVTTACTTYRSSPFDIAPGATVPHTATLTCVFTLPIGFGTSGANYVTVRACIDGGGCGPEVSEIFALVRPLP